MTELTIFEEKQRFNQWWLYAILLLPVGFIGYEIISKEINWNAVLIELLILALVFALIFSIQLKTKITETGIGVQFFPFVWKEKHFRWDEIKTMEVREYSPIAEYGGWGLRYSFKNGKAYNISGNNGLQLIFTNDKKLLIGTKKPEELKAALSKLNI